MLGEPKALRVILAQGAYVNSFNDDMKTPLFFAVNSNNAEAAALLIKNNADLQAKNRDGQTAFDLIPDIEEWLKKDCFDDDVKALLKSKHLNSAELIQNSINSLTFAHVS